MNQNSPWAKPNKVHDANAERLLGEVLSAIRDLNGRQAGLESALQMMAQRLADVGRSEPVDLSPIVGAIEQMAQRPVQVETAGPAVDTGGIVDELRQVVADVGIRPTQWDNLVERITDAVRPQGTMVVGGGGREMRLKDAGHNVINPATEETVGTLATEATVGTLATEATLGSVFKSTDPLAAGSNIVGFVSPSLAKKASEAKFFLADSGQVATDVTNNWINLTFTNPVGSGKNAYIIAITVESDQTSTWAKFYKDPTTNTPTTIKTAHNGINLLSTGAYASSMTVKGDPLSAEMDNSTDLVARITSNVSVRLELPPMIVTAGTTIGFGANLGGAGNGSVAVYWYEESA